MIWTILMALLAALIALDTLRMRGRLQSIGTLPVSEAPADPDYVFITAPGVTLDDATRRGATAFARERGFEQLDLIPRDLPTIRALSLAQILDLERYRRDRTTPGRTAGHAQLVTRAIAERAGVVDAVPADDPAFAQLAARLKYFTARADLAIAPAEHARSLDNARRLDTLHVVLGPATGAALAAQPIFWTLIALGLVFAPIAGWIALAAWHLQAPGALAGSGLRPRDLVLATVFRFPIELWLLVRTIASGRSHVAARAQRPAYDALLAGDTSRLLEPRRVDCPLCGSTELAVHLHSPDLFQHKPGAFTLDRCASCGVVFQNPRLSIDGLDFYYKDFYDGLGEAGMEMIFGYGAEPYHNRALMMKAVATPARWLDVGGGHGHFCATAREHLPATQFDGLDFGDAITEAAARGWVDKAYRGMFPDVAPTIAGAYDAISMSHYLEHVRDPKAELAAAQLALSPGGPLMIEVPDPEYRLGRVLGKWWLPWFQPQHQHLIPADRLGQLLRDAGFTPLVWHYREAHQVVDFFFAAWLLLDRIAPPAYQPWRWRGGGGSLWHTFVWTLGTPLIALGILTDHAVKPFLRSRRHTNTYRVLARRD